MEKITLRVFWICMLLTASCALIGIWTGGPDQPDNEPLIKVMMTFFIGGFASFLLWAPIVVYRFLNKK